MEEDYDKQYIVSFHKVIYVNISIRYRIPRKFEYSSYNSSTY